MRPPQRGDIWWLDLCSPRGSEPGFRRPGVIVQSNDFNRSSISTVIVALLTSNPALAEAPGNVFVPKRGTGLDRDSVVNVSQVVTVDRDELRSRIGRLPVAAMEAIDAGLRLVLDLDGSPR